MALESTLPEMPHIQGTILQIPLVPCTSPVSWWDSIAKGIQARKNLHQ